MQQLAENLWLLSYPLPLLGADLRRNVTVIRLRSGELVIHSTGPFTAQDAQDIRALGQPGWLTDVMLRHDTFAKQGRELFPGIPFLAPEGFSEVVKFPTEPILPTPPAWGDELAALLIEGVPSMAEHAFFHRPSRTLIVADLLFNFGPEASAWTHFLMLAAVGKEHHPGMARSMRMTAKDKGALKRSLDAVMAWDFDRIIVGHGGMVPSGGKQKMADALRRAGFYSTFQ